MSVINTISLKLRYNMVSNGYLNKGGYENNQKSLGQNHSSLWSACYRFGSFFLLPRLAG